MAGSVQGRGHGSLDFTTRVMRRTELLAPHVTTLLSQDEQQQYVALVLEAIVQLSEEDEVDNTD